MYGIYETKWISCLDLGPTPYTLYKCKYWKIAKKEIRNTSYLNYFQVKDVNIQYEIITHLYELLYWNIKLPKFIYLEIIIFKNEKLEMGMYG